MIWLGNRRGYLSDWATQQWVRFTGRRVALDGAEAWLAGPSGPTDVIGQEFFENYAARNGLEIVSGAGEQGLVKDLSLVTGGAAVHPAVRDFYEKTSEYEMDCWSEWSPAFRPFGKLLALIFSRRLQQLNVPLTGLDTHRGISSRVLSLRAGGVHRETAWVRQLRASQHTLYAGSYSVCRVPGYAGRCIKVCFPLPNGRAIVIMRAEVDREGSLTVISDGSGFGDPGFYFAVEEEETSWARYVRTMKESIRVYAAEPGVVRADHILRLYGRVFLRLHYRMKRHSA